MNNELFSTIVNKLDLRLKNKVPVIFQTEASECGLASLAMILNYYGLQMDMLNLRTRFGVSSRGMTLKTLIDIASTFNMGSRAISLELNELKLLKTPCILHWDLNHFIVLIKANSKKIIIHDPYIGRRVIDIQVASKHFTGVALELWPNSDFTQEKKQNRLNLLTFFKHIKGLKGALSKIFFLSMFIEAINLLLPVGTQLVLDHVIFARDHALLMLICVGLLFFILFRSFVSMLKAWISLKMGALIDIQWKAGLFEHMIKLPLAYFEKRKLGDIQSRFNSLNTIRTTFTTNIINSIIDCIMTIGVLIMMFMYGGWLIWIVLSFTAFFILLRLSTYQYYRQISEEQILKGAKAESHFMETLYSICTLKALGLSENRASIWLNMNIDTMNSEIKLTKFNMMFGGIGALIAAFDQIIILWIGATMVMDNQLTLGMFVAFNAYRGQFSERASNLVSMILQLRILGLHNERISDIVLSPIENYKPNYQLVRKGKPVDIEISNLFFQYDSLSKPIISNFNLKIKAGECIAIVGSSGIGKTTLMKLFSGLLIPDKGTIKFDGLDINTIGINNYRQHIACVLQDDKLLAGSIAENISGFDSEYDISQIRACAYKANIHEDIEKMPMKYKTIIGELGGGLSGGQKQRLLIARALYRKPSILFMDEATSHLDIKNETYINNAISQLNITRVIIAHRESTIASADRVIDLEKLL